MPSIDVLRSSFVSSRDNLINFLLKRILLSVVSGGSGMLSAEQRANEKKKRFQSRWLAFDLVITIVIIYKTAVMF